MILNLYFQGYLANSDVPLHIGFKCGENDMYFKGLLDEVTIGSILKILQRHTVNHTYDTCMYMITHALARAHILSIACIACSGLRLTV